MGAFMISSNEALLHSILYAKSHYETDPTYRGLRVMCGHYSAMDPECIDDQSLMHYSLILCDKFAPKVSLENFIMDAFRETKWYRPNRKLSDPNPTSISQLDIVAFVLSKLRYLQVSDLPPLPKADSSIYPLSENHKEYLSKQSQ